MALTRGDIAWARFYKDKTRPGVVVRNDAYGGGNNITLCPLTGTVSGHFLRPLVARGKGSGLTANSEVMVNRIATLPSARVQNLIGRVSAAEMRDIDTALTHWLGL